MSNAKEQAVPSIAERLAAAEARVAELEAQLRESVVICPTCVRADRLEAELTEARELVAEALGTSDGTGWETWADRARAALAGGGR